MSVFCLRDDGLVMSQDAVTHFTTSTPPPSDSSADVLILHAPQNLSTVSPHLRNSIWSYVYPGKGEECKRSYLRFPFDTVNETPVMSDL